MSRKSIAALLVQADATLEDNTAGGITPADVRAMVRDMLDTFAPAGAALGSANLTMAALFTTPRVIPYTASFFPSPDYTVVQGLGQITRLARGLPGTVDRVRFSAAMSGPSGAEVQFQVYKDGAPMEPLLGATITISGSGAGNFAQAAISIAAVSNDANNHVFEVRASKVSGAADDILLTDVRFSLNLMPTL